MLPHYVGAHIPPLWMSFRVSVKGVLHVACCVHIVHYTMHNVLTPALQCQYSVLIRVGHLWVEKWSKIIFTQSLGAL